MEPRLSALAWSFDSVFANSMCLGAWVCSYLSLHGVFLMLWLLGHLRGHLRGFSTLGKAPWQSVPESIPAHASGSRAHAPLGTQPRARTLAGGAAHSLLY